MAKTAPQLNQLNLVVQDMAKAIAFYRLLGVKVPAAWGTASGLHHCDIDFGAMELSLDSVALAKVYNKGYRKRRGGAGVVGFRMPSRRAVDAAYAKLVAAGHEGQMPPHDAWWGARYAIVEDPDGNHVGLMSASEAKHRRPGPDL